MDLTCGYFLWLFTFGLDRFGYSRSAPSIFHNILVVANKIVALSHSFCVYNLEYAYFQITRCTFWSNSCEKLGLNLFCILSLSFITQKQFAWSLDCQVEWLKIVHVMRNWYHFAMIFFSQTLYLVRPRSFKNVSNQKPLFAWMKIKLFFFYFWHKVEGSFQFTRSLSLS